jgi:hypothetical protein
MARASGKVYVGTRGISRVYEITDNGSERTSRVVVDKLNQRGHAQRLARHVHRQGAALRRD